MVYHTENKIDLDNLKKSIKKLESVKEGDIQVKSLPGNTDSGPTSKITHRIVLSGEDQKGLLNKIVQTLDKNNAIIVRMNTEKITFPNNTQYIARFAIAIRDENAPQCLSQIVKVAGQMKLTFRYETS
jgi:glycine cleavage system transcriptional repressor